MDMLELKPIGQYAYPGLTLDAQYKYGLICKSKTILSPWDIHIVTLVNVYRAYADAFSLYDYKQLLI